MRDQILGVERRRFWHDDDKLEIVMSVGVGGASVTQVAQRHEIRRQQIYAWRHDLKQKGLWSPDAGALFYPLVSPMAGGNPLTQCRASKTPPPTAVELRLRDSRCLHFDSTMDPVSLTALIRAGTGVRALGFGFIWPLAMVARTNGAKWLIVTDMRKGTAGLAALTQDASASEACQWCGVCVPETTR
jgi:transposase